MSEVRIAKRNFKRVRSLTPLGWNENVQGCPPLSPSPPLSAPFFLPKNEPSRVANPMPQVRNFRKSHTCQKVVANFGAKREKKSVVSFYGPGCFVLLMTGICRHTVGERLRIWDPADVSINLGCACSLPHSQGAT